MKQLITIKALLLCIGVSSAAQAHHSANANYDLSRRVELKGTVVEFVMRSPHSIVRLGVKNAKGETEVWVIETHALPTLRRAGWTPNTLKAGETLTVQAFPNRRPGVHVVNAREFIRADGTVLGGAAQTFEGPAQPAVSSLGSIAGRWKPELFPPANYDARESVLPLTETARRAWANYDLRRSPAKSCMPNNIPDILYPPYLYDLRVRNGKIVLRNELWNVTRVVPLDALPARVDSTGQFGQASATIENGQLIVRSERYPPNPWGLGMAGTPLGGAGDVPSSERKSVMERYWTSADGKVLTVEYTLHDPVMLTKPYTARQTFRRVPDSMPIYPYDCERESARLYDQGSKPR